MDKVSKLHRAMNGNAGTTAGILRYRVVPAQREAFLRAVSASVSRPALMIVPALTPSPPAVVAPIIIGPKDD